MASQSDIADIFSLIILRCGGCPVYHKMFSSILGLSPQNANSILPLVMTSKNACREMGDFMAGEGII